MSFYIRKSLSFGPVRFNLSNRGIGVSAGIKGFRVGTGPRGNYVHVGRGGFYYRASLSQRRNGSPGSPAARPAEREPQPPVLTSQSLMLDVDSSAVGQIVDASSQAIVNEIREKERLWRMAPWIGILGCLATVYGFAVNLVGLGVGFAVAFGIGFLVALRFDRNRKTTVIFYDFEDETGGNFKELHEALEAIASAVGFWHIPTKGDVGDAKYNAGAKQVVTRNSIAVGFDHPKFIRTNIPIPNFSVGSQHLYFFPDRIFIFGGGDVGALTYESVQATINPTGFIETESVPRDSERIGQTWRYVNKKGGPDRRFKDNPELPIMKYEQIHLRSDSGLNELVMISRIGIFQRVDRAIKRIISSSELHADDNEF